MAQGILYTKTPEGDRTDYLYRISLKAYIKNDAGEVLVVKEAGRTEWDLPGGGISHGETVKAALARELKEEVCFEGDFTYRPLRVDDARVISSVDLYQLRIIFEVIPKEVNFRTGVDCDDMTFVSPESFRDSDALPEQNIYRYSLQLKETENAI